MMTSIPVTLATAAAAVFVNIWLGWRISQLRKAYKVSVGDGGHEPLLRRMRAQANFVENAPFFLILLIALELSSTNRLALLAVAATFMLARIAHGVGMDGGDGPRWRMYGTMGSTIATAALAIWALVHAVTSVV